jgi:polyisoprenoid-binding protein YceI/cytochrome c
MRFLLLSALLAQAAFANAWTVAPRPHGTVKFKVVGPVDDVVGVTTAASGNLDISLDDVTASKGVFAVNLGAITTGIDQRDQDMRGEFLEVTRFPFAILALGSISKPSAKALAVGQTVTGEASGTFEIHGVRRTVLFPVKLKLDSDQKLVVSGEFPVALADYAITRPQRLFFKLGEVADVTFEIHFAPKDAVKAVAAKELEAEKSSPNYVAAPTESTVKEIKPLAPKPKARPVKKPKPALAFKVVNTGVDPKSVGERLFHEPLVGGEGNKITCFHCHAKADERNGLVQSDGFSRPANTLFNAGQRPTFWGGFAKTVGAAADICQKQFMLGSGLSDEQKTELTAFVDSISADGAPGLDFATFYSSMDTLLRDPTGGDAARGEKLSQKYCMTCHLDGRVGPVWAPGLYEADWVVRRVRRLEGHQNKQMPPFTIARLPDTDLRDIVTYLTTSKSEPKIFNRKAAAQGGQP